MNLRQLCDQTLITENKRLVVHEREIITEVLHHLNEIDIRKLYAKYNCTSLFEFATRVLGYSEPQAQRRISAARLLRVVPEIETKISSGALNLTNVSQAQTFFRQESKLKTITTEEKKEVLKKIENLSTRETEKLLLSLSQAPEKLIPEKARAISSTHTELRLIADEEFMAMLQRAREIFSHKMPLASQMELLKELGRIALEQVDPLRKAQRFEQKVAVANAPSKPVLEHGFDERIAAPNVESISEKGFEQTTSASNSQIETISEKSSNKEPLSAPQVKVPEQRASSIHHDRQRQALSSSVRSRYIPQSMRRKIWLRDQGQCRFVNDQGIRCSCRFQLEMDHVKPFALGGDHNEENLRLLCRAHNQYSAVTTFGVRNELEV